MSGTAIPARTVVLVTLIALAPPAAAVQPAPAEQETRAISAAPVAAFGGQTLTVGPDGSYATIPDAVAAASEEDRIEIRPGIYDSSFKLDKNLTLAAPRGARLTGRINVTRPSSDVPLTVRLRGVSFAENGTTGPSGIEVDPSQSGRVNLTNVRFADSTAGLTADESGADIELDQVVFSPVGASTAITANQIRGSVTIENSSFSDGQTAIDAYTVGTNTDPPGVVTVNGSSLTGLSGPVIDGSLSTTEIDATDNWWGTASGPDDDGCVGNVDCTDPLSSAPTSPAIPQHPDVLDTNDGRNRAFANDRTGESGVTTADPDITLTSLSDGDLADADGRNITVEIPREAALTFDQRSSPTFGPESSYVNRSDLNSTVRFQSDRLLSISLRNGSISAGETISITGVDYNLTAGSASRTRLRFETNETDLLGSSLHRFLVTLYDPDTVRGDIDVDDAEGHVSAPNLSVSPDATVTSSVNVTNASSGLDGLGGEVIDLSIVRSPSGGSASLNTSTVTTNDAGRARFNVSLGSVPGLYTVRATGQTTASANTTFSYRVSSRLKTNASRERVFANDRDGERGVPTADPDILLTSIVATDLADFDGRNVTVTVPSDAPLTFDQRSRPAFGDDSDYVTENGSSVRLVGPRTINVTLTDGNIGSGEDINITGVSYNLTAGEAGTTRLKLETNETDLDQASENRFVVRLTPPSSMTGTINAATGRGQSTEPRGTFDAGLNVTSGIKVSNSSSGLGALGAEPVSLQVTSTPSGASAALNTTTITTRSNGLAEFNVTLGNTPGLYNVTATSQTNSSVELVFQYVVEQQPRVSVQPVENALRNDGTVTGEQYVSVYEVRVEDQFGRLVKQASVDVDLVFTGDAELARGPAYKDGVATDFDSGTGLATGTRINDTNGDGRFNYNTTIDEALDGVFYVFATDETAEEVTLNAVPNSTNISRGSGTTTFFDGPDVIRIGFDPASPVPGGSTVTARATVVGPDGNDIAVPRLPVKFRSTNRTVAAVASDTPSRTDENGRASTQLVTGDTGISRVSASLDDVTGERGLTISGTPFRVNSGSVAPRTAYDDGPSTHEIEYTVTNASDDGVADTYTITLPNTTSIVTINDVTVADAAGTPISTTASPEVVDADGGTGNRLRFEIAPSAALDTSLLTVTVSIDVSFPQVDEQRTVPIVADVTEGDRRAIDSTTIDDVILRDADSAPPPVGSSGERPADRDGDGLYEDVDGSGGQTEPTILDVIALLEAFDEDPSVTNNPSAFNFNEGPNDTVNILDVIALLEQV